MDVRLDSARWAPILEGGLCRKAYDALFAIDNDLPPPGSPSSDTSLANGEPGFAVFQAYLARSGLLPPDTAHRHRERARAYLQCAAEKLSGTTSALDLYSGFTGLAWAANHLQSMGLLDDCDELCDVADEVVLDGLNDHHDELLCELITGLSGVGLYGLSRWPRPAARKIVRHVVHALEDSAVTHQGCRTWFNAPEKLSAYGRHSHPTGCFNLGLSHGVQGALVFLAGAAAHHVPAARKLLTEGREWLVRQQRCYPNGSRLGYSFVHDPDEELYGSRVSWCYGDLGVAAALMVLARRARRTDWEPVALDLARGVAQRLHEDADVNDAALCHGALGNAHLFGRLYAATGESVLRGAALRWIRAGLALRKEGTGLAGFSAWMPRTPDEEPREEWIPSAGMLCGICGIGLALLGFVSPVEPAWDEMLMVNIPLVGA